MPKSIIVLRLSYTGFTLASRFLFSFFKPVLTIAFNHEHFRPNLLWQINEFKCHFAN